MVSNNPTKKRRLIPMHDVLSRVPFSRTHLYRLKSRGDFPKSVKMPHGKKCLFWEHEVEKWMEGLK